MTCSRRPATSHSSQAATADRVLVHVDTEQVRYQFADLRVAHVSVSPGQVATVSGFLTGLFSHVDPQRRALVARRNLTFMPRRTRGQEGTDRGYQMAIASRGEKVYILVKAESMMSILL